MDKTLGNVYVLRKQVKWKGKKRRLIKRISLKFPKFLLKGHAISLLPITCASPYVLCVLFSYPSVPIPASALGEL